MPASDPISEGPGAPGERRSLGSKDFARMFGIAEADLPVPCRNLIDELDFTYTVAKGAERDAIIRGALETLDQSMEVSGPSRLGRWEEGWSENLHNYRKSGGDLESLIPGYYRRGITVMRLFGDYVTPVAPWFEVHVLRVLQAWIACTFLPDVETVCEFGCGPAHNLIAFASQLPDKHYVGLDWATASQQVIEEIAKRENFQISGRRFDMFSPEDFDGIPARSAALTIGAMEQLGVQFQPFLDYLLAQDAALYLHVEPILELHDTANLLGYLGFKYMKKRGYLTGYLDELRALEQKGQIQITHCRTLIGSTNYNGWNLIVWRKT